MLRAAHDYTESVDDYGYRSPGTWGPLLEVQEAAEEALSIITEFREVIFPYGPQDEPESAPVPPATTTPTPPTTPPASPAPASASAQSPPRLPVLKRRRSDVLGSSQGSPRPSSRPRLLTPPHSLLCCLSNALPAGLHSPTCDNYTPSEPSSPVHTEPGSPIPVFNLASDSESSDSDAE